MGHVRKPGARPPASDTKNIRVKAVGGFALFKGQFKRDPRTDGGLVAAQGSVVQPQRDKGLRDLPPGHSTRRLIVIAGTKVAGVLYWKRDGCISCRVEGDRHAATGIIQSRQPVDYPAPSVSRERPEVAARKSAAIVGG